jgi:hypothetical protein
MKNTRREFIKHSGLAGFVLRTSGIRKALDGMIPGKPQRKVSILSPVDGDMLCSYDGLVTRSGLKTKVTLLGPPGLNVTVNGIQVDYQGGQYHTEVLLKEYRNNIEVMDVSSDDKQSVVVFWLKNYADKYRLSLDDNIWFLQDISTHAGVYRSIFENPYLGFLKQVHDTYGTKIHINIYYQTEEFNLSHLTDRYKGEWKDQANWLRMSFHALQNDPDKPYKYAGYDIVKKDCELVKEQIRRFAGEELMGPVTTLHWGEATVEGCRALRDSGYTALAGYFNVNHPEPVSYYLQGEQLMQASNRYIWRDNLEGIIFARMAIVINTLPLDQIVPYLDKLRSNSHKPPYADMMIHEQYFYPFYSAYQPDYREKVMTSVKWAVEKGYKPAFLSECVFS